jgi:hypothetical protein
MIQTFGRLTHMLVSSASCCQAYLKFSHIITVRSRKLIRFYYCQQNEEKEHYVK